MKFRYLRYIVIALATLFFVILFLRTAWLNDDSYITFRTVDNFVNGYGLRWNVIERVQAYTNPLWMFVISAAYFFTREMFLTPIFISIALSLTTVTLLFYFHTKNVFQVILSVVILGFSRAFVDYSSSGLENPLTHLLLVIFCIIFFSDTPNKLKLFSLAFIPSLSAFNRLDTICIYLPSLIYSWWKQEKRLESSIIMFIGFMPLILWEIFSVIYYGFPVPNTAVAKLQNYIDRRELLLQGFYYFKWLFDRDLSSFIVIVIALLLPFFRKNAKLLTCSLGILLYCIYILWIGGDFMGGRFFSVLILLSTILIIRFLLLKESWKRILATLILLILSLIKPNVPILTDENFGKDQSWLRDESGIGDDRMYYFQISSLAHWEPGEIMPKKSFASVKEGLNLREQNKQITKVYGCIGFRGFFAGPKVYLIDYWALADPLLARIPPLYKPKWMIGHFWRHVPEGYVESFVSDSNKIKDPNLAEFYEHLKTITRGPIWSFGRWKEIIKMNLGIYNHLIDKDRYQFAGIKVMNINDINNMLTRLKINQGIKVPKRGLEIQFPETRQNVELDIDLKTPKTFYLLFFNNTEFLYRVIVKTDKIESPFQAYKVKIPQKMIQKGFNKIRIFVYPRDVESEIRTIHFTNI
ncbi:MAG TPA: hypothetical protein PLX23_08470 [Candidatus Hydrogenedens sp.]|nr:hypothetical protein [Candidatus Hydrogenedens sp.]